MTTPNRTVGVGTTSVNGQLDALLDLMDVVRKHFPLAWPLVESCLSAMATLLLKDATDPTALLLVGAPSGLKTTVFNMVECAPFPSYRSDKFSSKSFVSHHAGVSRRALSQVDLLPRIRYRVLLTPELAPMFRGRHDDLVEHFSILTRVLDGQGLLTDSGVHGQRGYTGDYFFAWLGATTPLPGAAWEIMAQLGSRLFFLPVPDDDPSSEEIEQAIRGQQPFPLKVQACRRATSQFIHELLPTEEAIRSVDWNRSVTPDEYVEALKELASLLAHLRSVAPVIGRLVGNRPEFGPPVVEMPYRALAVMHNIARGHALLYGRRYLTLGDVALLVPIALGSCPDHRRRLFQALLEAGASGAALRAAEGASRLKVSTETARGYLQEMTRLEGGEGFESTPLTQC